MQPLRPIVAALACLAAAMLATAAHGQGDRVFWRQATTPHFTVFARGREADVGRMATELELFDGAMRQLHGLPDEPALHANKVTVFVVPDPAAVQRLCGGCGNVYGFYSADVSGGVAFTPRDTAADSRTDLQARTVLYHEYGHHFLLGNYAAAYPPWFTEGYAEFVSTAKFTDDLVVMGQPPLHRAYGLFGLRPMPVRNLFDRADRKRIPGEEVEATYGRGWVFTHYMMFDRKVHEQFLRYMKAINAGTPNLKAATDAFGDLRKLDQALDTYLNRRRLSVLNIARKSLPAPQVALRVLSPGEAAMIELRMQSVRGVSDKTAGPLFRKAEPVAGKFGDDPVAQAWFAEIAFDAGEFATARDAADRALARDPGSVQALLYRGRAALALADKARAGPADWAAARQFIVKANRADPDRAAPLAAYYTSFLTEGRAPTAAAKTGLLRAHELVPQDPDLRMMAVDLSVRDGELARAKALLVPLAYGAHRAADNPAAKLLAALETAPSKEAAVAALDSLRKEAEATGKAAGKKE